MEIDFFLFLGDARQNERKKYGANRLKSSGRILFFFFFGSHERGGPYTAGGNFQNNNDEKEEEEEEALSCDVPAEPQFSNGVSQERKRPSVSGNQ